MTILQAIQQAQETGQIAITKKTANILKALAEFDQAAADLTTAIDDNLPSEMSDRETSDNIMGEFYRLYSPLQEYVFKTIGNVMLSGAFNFQLIGKFEGL